MLRAWQNPSWQIELDAAESRLKLRSDLRPSRASYDLQELCEQTNAFQPASLNQMQVQLLGSAVEQDRGWLPRFEAFLSMAIL